MPARRQLKPGRTGLAAPGGAQITLAAICVAVPWMVGPSWTTSSFMAAGDHGMATLTAATTSPERERTGAAMDRSALSSSSSLVARPVRRTCSSSASSECLSVSVRGPALDEVDPVQEPLEIAAREEGQQRLARGAAVGGQPRAHVQAELEVVVAARPSADPVDQDHVDVVADGQVRRVPGGLGQAPQMRRPAWRAVLGVVMSSRR
jgi:hypothetical protein